MGIYFRPMILRCTEINPGHPSPAWAETAWRVYNAGTPATGFRSIKDPRAQLRGAGRKFFSSLRLL